MAAQKFWQEISTRFPQVQAVVDMAMVEVQATIESVMHGITVIVSETLKALQQFWADNGDGIMKTVVAAFGIIGKLFQNAMQMIRAVVDTVLALIRGDWSAFGDGLKKITELFVKGQELGFKLLWTIIGPIVTNIKNGIISAITTAWNGIVGNLTNIKNGIINAITNAWNGITGNLTNIKNGIINAITNAWNGITGNLTNIKNGIINAITNAWNGITGNLTNIKDGIVNAITNAWNGITGNLTNIKDGIVNAITNAWNGITGNLANIKNGIVNAITNAWNGITGNLANIKNGIVNAITNAWNGITGNLANIKNGITSAIRDAVSGIAAPLTSIRTKISDAMESVKTFLRNTFSWGDTAVRIGEALMNAIGNAIRNGVTVMAEALKNVLRAALSGLPQPIRDALELVGIRTTRSAPVPAPAPVPTSRSGGAIMSPISPLSKAQPAIVVNITIGSVRDQRDIDAIERAVTRGMSEAARRGIVQSQLPRGI
jgi:phage-related protein